MAPLMQDGDISLSSHDDALGHNKVATPLHESFRKQVSFGPMVRVQEVLSRKNFTREELDATWYDLNDVQRMREIARTEAKLVDSGNFIKGKNISYRGLEAKTKKGAKWKRDIRMNSFAAVFLEIDFQKEEKNWDERAIADAYFTYSLPCTMAAQKLGKLDEIEARRIWNIPKNVWRSKSRLLQYHRHELQHKQQGRIRQVKTNNHGANVA
jgi:hypothetical protein